MTEKEKIIHRKLKIGEIRENSLTFAPNILYIIEKETCPGYISEVNSN